MSTEILAKLEHPNQPLGLDKHGVLRFKSNAIVKEVLDFASSKGFDMNTIAAHVHSDDDRRQFAQLIGYSLNGYSELSYVSQQDYEVVATAYDEGIPNDKDAKIAYLEHRLFRLKTQLKEPFSELFGVDID